MAETTGTRQELRPGGGKKKCMHGRLIASRHAMNRMICRFTFYIDNMS